MPTIEAVLFDFGGTLDADGARWSVRFHQGYRELSGGLALPAFEEIFRDVDRRLGRVPGIARMGFRAMVETESQLLVSELPDGAKIPAEELAARFCGRAVRTVRRNIPLLERLAVRWPLGIISNFTGNLERCLEELELRKYFRLVVDSAVVGREKPDPQLFLDACAVLGTEALCTWMVGDNPEADIRPALQLGMSACWVTEATRRTPDGLGPAVRIEQLPELELLLESACTV
ncbi:MAG TPA: HAD family hydrolase [Gemmatimonadales bacterium]|nr:HAD family hydrolase [Gemmatimonadales bacterium]